MSPIISALAVRGPGFEIGYTQITANVNVTDTSEATATALISPGALTFDGGAVLLSVVAPIVQPPSTLNGTVTFTLFEGATQIARLGIVSNAVATILDTYPINLRYRFTPTAGAHTYKICGFVSSVTGTPFLGAGVPGTGAYAPAYARFEKV